MISKSQAKRLCYQQGIPMSMMNRLANSSNRFQGDTKKVLCVCSAGLLRSPTAAVVLAAEPFNFNTRAVGCVREYALIAADEVLLSWADEIVVMERKHFDVLNERYEAQIASKVVHVLNIDDNFRYRDPELMLLISGAYKTLSNLVTESPGDDADESTWESTGRDTRGPDNV